MERGPRARQATSTRSVPATSTRTVPSVGQASDERPSTHPPRGLTLLFKVDYSMNKPIVGSYGSLVVFCFFYSQAEIAVSSSSWDQPGVASSEA
jgi:hypothetical protein